MRHFRSAIIYMQYHGFYKTRIDTGSVNWGNIDDRDTVLRLVKVLFKLEIL